MESNLEFIPKVHSTPVCTETPAQCTKEWVINSWQLVLSDEVGSHCSWTGIRKKQCSRDLRVTHIHIITADGSPR
ncbi:hypothetical protein ACLKA7_012384 [Drosophila subpalustris]